MLESTNRLPRLAGRFYPRDQKALREQIEAMSPAAKPAPATALMLPHAGYAYSGTTAMATVARTALPPVVVLIGPKHTRRGAPMAINLQGRWRTPLGFAEIDEVVAAKVGVILDAQHDDEAHADEHCLEVLLPMLQSRRPDVRIVPVVVGRDLDGARCAQMGEDLADALPHDVLLIASSDMHHQGVQDLPAGETTQGRVQRLSALALEHVDAEDPAGLVARCRADHITMCGVLPTAIAMGFAKRRGAKPQRVALTDSQTVAGGDPSWVVGYAGYRWAWQTALA